MKSLVPRLLKPSFKHFQGPSKVAKYDPFPIFHGFHVPLYLITFLPNNLGSSYHLKEFLKLVFTAAKLTESVVPGCWAMRIVLLLWKPIVYDSEVSSTCVRMSSLQIARVLFLDGTSILFMFKFRKE